MEGLKVWEFGVQLAIGDPAHKVAELKQDKVNVGHVVAHQELLAAEVVRDLPCLRHADSSDRLLISIGVAWHRCGTLKV